MQQLSPLQLLKLLSSRAPQPAPEEKKEESAAPLPENKTESEKDSDSRAERRSPAAASQAYADFLRRHEQSARRAARRR